MAQRSHELRGETSAALERRHGRLAAIESLLDVVAARVVRVRGRLGGVATDDSDEELAVAAQTLDRFAPIEYELALVEHSVKELSEGETRVSIIRPA